jgi:tRNA (guanosine-2'-O-)-methyltransferase
MHNTSAVMRSCEIFGIQAKCEQRYGKSIDKEMGLKNGLTLIPMIVLQLVDTLKKERIQIIATTHEKIV